MFAAVSGFSVKAALYNSLIRPARPYAIPRAVKLIIINYNAKSLPVISVIVMLYKVTPRVFIIRPRGIRTAVDLI